MRRSRRWVFSVMLALALAVVSAGAARADGNGAGSVPAPGAAAEGTAGRPVVAPAATQLTLTLTLGAAPGTGADAGGPAAGKGPAGVGEPATGNGMQTAQATAVLTGPTGRPIQKANVVFRRKTTFGQVTLDTVATDFEGAASTTMPAYPGQRIEVTAEYSGGPGLAPAQAAGTLSLPEGPVPRHLGIYSQVANPWYLAALLLVVGGVWSTYGYAFHLVRRIKRAGAAVADTQ